MTRHNTYTSERIREAALRPMAPSGRRFWVVAAILGILAAWGVAAYIYQYFNGLGVAGYTDHGFWGIYEANLVAFIGVSYGGALVSAILRLTNAKWRAPITRMAEAMALFSLLIGALFAIVHLGRPERIWRFFVPGVQMSSPIVWDFVAVMTYLVATVIFLYLPLIPDIAVLRDRLRGKGGWREWMYRVLSLNWHGGPEQRRLLDQSMMTIAVLIIPIAVVVHSVLSWAFAVTGRPGWHSTIFAPYFVIAALYSGVAMVILVVAAFRRGYHLEDFITPAHFRNLAYLMLSLDLMYLYFTFTELLTEGYAMHEDVVPVLEALLVGQYAPFFWLFILGGGIVPLLIVAIPKTRTVSGIVVAAGLVVAGMWLKRLLIVVPAVAHPLIQQVVAGTWGAFHPTWVAIGITVGSAAAIPLLLMAFFKFFPILSIYEIEELAELEETSDVATLPHQTGRVLQEGRLSR